MRWLILLLILAGCAQVQTDWTVTVEGQEFSVEVVQEREEIMRGLMHRESMEENQGMLFLFPNEIERTFWMKNTLIPLDIIFISRDYKIVKIQEAIPCESEPCPLYPSVEPAQYVLEINGGLAKKYGFKEGSIVNMRNA